MVRQLPSAEAVPREGHSCELFVFNTAGSWGSERQRLGGSYEATGVLVDLGD